MFNANNVVLKLCVLINFYNCMLIIMIIYKKHIHSILYNTKINNYAGYVENNYLLFMISKWMNKLLILVYKKKTHYLTKYFQIYC
jgi:hypothetical protein